MPPRYTVELLTTDEYDAIVASDPRYVNAADSLGFADPEAGKAYARFTTWPALNEYLVQHEFEHLLHPEEGADKDEYGIYHKKVFKEIIAPLIKVAGVAAAPFTGGLSLLAAPAIDTGIAIQEGQRGVGRTALKSYGTNVLGAGGGSAIGGALGGGSAVARGLGGAVGAGGATLLTGGSPQQAIGNALIGGAGGFGQSSSLFSGGAKAGGAKITGAATSPTANAVRPFAGAVSPTAAPSTTGGLGGGTGGLARKSVLDLFSAQSPTAKAFGLPSVPPVGSGFSPIASPTATLAQSTARQAATSAVTPQLLSANNALAASKQLQSSQGGGIMGLFGGGTPNIPGVPTPAGVSGGGGGTQGILGNIKNLAKDVGKQALTGLGVNAVTGGFGGGMTGFGGSFGDVALGTGIASIPFSGVGPQTPDIPNLNDLPRVREFAGRIESQLGPLSERARNLSSTPLPEDFDRRIRRDYDRFRQEVTSQFKAFRPGADLATDSAYRQAMQDVEFEESEALAQAQFGFIEQERQNIAAQLGVDQELLQQLGGIAQLDITQIIEQTGLDAAEAAQFKELFGNLGAIVAGGGFRQPQGLQLFR